MPSLHFGYSLLIGLTIATIPLPTSPSHPSSPVSPNSLLPLYHYRTTKHTSSTSPQRILCIAIGAFYPCLILLAIIATANHFLLDAVAGAMVCAVAWWGNGFMLNLCAVEDWFLWVVRIHKPGCEESVEGAMKVWEERKGSWVH